LLTGRELWHKNGKVSQNVINAKTEFDKVERKLRGMMDRDTSLGLAAVNDIAKRKKLNGVYGPLYDLFHVEDRHKIAVETVAGASLFHVVVDTNETAEKLIETMVQEKRGRVTFMPLNRLKSVNVQYPQASDAVPMMSKIKETDPKFKPALEQVFGRTVICTDLAVAAQYARSHTLNAITEDGDRADRKGAISGGYHDMSRSRLDTIKQLKRWRDLYEESQREHEQDKAQLSALEHEITQKMSAIHLLEAKRKATIENLNQSRRSNWTQREIELTRQSVERLERSLEDAQAARDGAEAQKNALRDELKTPFAQQLSPQELQLLDTLSKQAEAEKRTLAEASQARLKVSSERSLLNSELTENLYRRKEELRRKVDELDAAAGSGVLQAGEVAHREAKLGSIVKSIQSLSASITAADKAVGKQTEVIAKKNAELDELQQDQQKKTREIIMAQRNADRFVSTTQKLKMRQQEAQNTIRDLGVLPEEAFSKYTGRNSNDVSNRQVHSSLTFSSPPSWQRSTTASRSLPTSTRRRSSSTPTLPSSVRTS
jgi:structural maintenance of chromosome 3 (chondroitin sulfate proteoglycan 6)